MRSKPSHLRLSSLLLVALTGCAQLTPDRQHQIEASEQVSRVDRHSTFPSIRRIYFEQVNLVEMIDPQSLAQRAYKQAWDATKGLADDRNWGVRYDLVLNWFRENNDISDEKKRIHRNSVQDKILAVSTSRCNVFKTFLRRQQSDVNFMLGAATTVAGVLGAVLPGVTASRNLAGTAGGFSGLQAEYNNAYYNNLTAHVIVQGIEVRQSRLQKELLLSRHGKSISEYSMESAINDAIFIDGNCSTVAGLIEAADSIKEVTNPGLARAAEVIASVRAASEIAQADKVSSLAESGKLDKLLKQASPTISPLAVAAAKPDVLAVTSLYRGLADASMGGKHVEVAIEKAGAELADAFAVAQSKLGTDDRSTLTPQSVKRLFSDAVQAVTKDLPIDKCAQALVDPAQKLGSAEATAQLEAKDETARIRAEQDLGAARANARAAVRRMTLLVQTAAATADGAAKAWEVAASRAKLTEQQLKAAEIPKISDGLKSLCG